MRVNKFSTVFSVTKRRVIEWEMKINIALYTKKEKQKQSKSMNQMWYNDCV